MVKRRISLIQWLWNGWFLAILVAKLLTRLQDWISLILFLACFLLQILAQYFLVGWVKDAGSARNSLGRQNPEKASAAASPGSVIPSRKEDGVDMKHKAIYARIFFLLSAILVSIYLFRVEDPMMFFILLAGILCYLMGIELFFRVIHELGQSLSADSK
jgi:hypothetical protein